MCCDFLQSFRTTFSQALIHEEVLPCIALSWVKENCACIVLITPLTQFYSHRSSSSNPVRFLNVLLCRYPSLPHPHKYHLELRLHHNTMLMETCPNTSDITKALCPHNSAFNISRVHFFGYSRCSRIDFCHGICGVADGGPTGNFI